MNSRIHIKLLVAGAAVLAAGAAAALADISPNPVTFAGPSVKRVLVTNTSLTGARYQVAIVPAGSAFTVQNARDCIHLPPHGKCILKVAYKPSGAAEDRATLRVTAPGQPPQQTDLIGRSSGGGGGDGGNNAPNCTISAKRHQTLVKRKGRSPLQVAVLSSEDGTVSARAAGKTAAGKTISFSPAHSPDTAGNGVVLKLKLKRSSERRIRKELAGGRTPKMTLVGTCASDGGSGTAHAAIRFHDGKRGKGFKLPLVADIAVK